MCETRDFGHKMAVLAHILSLMMRQKKFDMRNVCPTDGQKMLVQRARSVYWKKWAANHEYEEVKEGAWIEPALALLRKKAKGVWTEKHRNVARKIFLEGGLDAEETFRYWLVGCEPMSSLPDEGRHRKALALPLSRLPRRKAGYSGALQKAGAKGENVEERVEVATR